MRVDNDGEGGIIALMTLLGVKTHQRPIISAVGLFGAALIYGDGAITPAISVLSALEGVEQIAPSLTTCVLPAATVVLLALFAVQPFGTAALSKRRTFEVLRAHKTPRKLAERADATCTCAGAPGLSGVPGRMTRYRFAEGSSLSTICRIGPMALTIAAAAGLVIKVVSGCNGPLPSGSSKPPGGPT